jgi:ribosomal protein S18 acetylase RimI-like enzyme
MLLTFTTEQTCSRADEIVSYLLGPRLWIPSFDYPDFEEWLQKVHGQLKSEQKRAVVALSRGGVVGAVLYQRKAGEPSTVEMKNVTVRPDARGRYVASFLLRNAEVEAATDFGVREAMVDAKARNLGIRAYLMHNGYRASRTEDLYGLGAGADVVYRKRLPAPGPLRL